MAVDPKLSAGRGVTSPSATGQGGAGAVDIPRTAVPNGVVDPVASARAELKAALFAIEEKGNVPRRLEKATVQGKAKARAFAQRNPVGAVAAAVGVAVVVGGIVWAVARSIAR